MSQALYEVTGSGVYQDFNHDILNGNRLRARSCDHQGDGPFNQACVFPFRYQVPHMDMLEMLETVERMEMVEMVEMVEAVLAPRARPTTSAPTPAPTRPGAPPSQTTRTPTSPDTGATVLH